MPDDTARLIAIGDGEAAANVNTAPEDVRIRNISSNRMHHGVWQRCCYGCTRLDHLLLTGNICALVLGLVVLTPLVYMRCYTDSNCIWNATFAKDGSVTYNGHIICDVPFYGHIAIVVIATFGIVGDWLFHANDQKGWNYTKLFFVFMTFGLIITCTVIEVIGCLQFCHNLDLDDDSLQAHVSGQGYIPEFLAKIGYGSRCYASAEDIETRIESADPLTNMFICGWVIMITSGLDIMVWCFLLVALCRKIYELHW